MTNQQVLANTFGILGNIISFGVFLAPSKTFYKIYKNKSTQSFQSLPYQVSLFSCMLWLYYALNKENAFLVITINAIGCVIETIYIVLFFTYATKDKRISAMKLFLPMNVALFAIILLITQFAIKNSSLQVTVIGWICVSISVSVFAAPLMIVARVMKTKSVEFMPFSLSLFLTISAIVWFAYGFFLEDKCIAIPNVVGFLLGMFQMVVYGIYKNSRVKLDIEKMINATEQQLMSIVVLGVSEVHPVDVTNVGPLSDAVYLKDPSKVITNKETEEEKEPSVHDGNCHVEIAPI